MSVNPFPDYSKYKNGDGAIGFVYLNPFCEVYAARTNTIEYLKLLGPLEYVDDDMVQKMISEYATAVGLVHTDVAIPLYGVRRTVKMGKDDQIQYFLLNQEQAERLIDITQVVPATMVSQ